MLKRRLSYAELWAMITRVIDVGSTHRASSISLSSLSKLMIDVALMIEYPFQTIYICCLRATIPAPAAGIISASSKHYYAYRATFVTKEKL